MSKILRKYRILGLLSAAAMALSACDPNAPATVSVGAGIYYDSLLWNDYYHRPPRPGRPPPAARPPRPTPPIARPPRPTPPIHRPPRPGRPR